MESCKRAKTPIRTSSKPSFLDLPVAVRFAIYRTLLVQPKPLTPLHCQGIERYLEKSATRKSLLRAGVRLLQTCKKILDEATSILYTENFFSLRPDGIEEIPIFLDRIGRSNCSKISFLNINFEYSQAKRWRGRLYSQGEASYTITQREDLYGLVDGNDFLPEYPISGQVYFADLETIKDSIPSHRFEDSEWGEEFLLENVGALGSEDMYHGYPLWGSQWDYVFWNANEPAIIIEALDSLKKCCNLRRLELWFPDPQRFVLGYALLKEDRMFLRRLWSLKGLSELIVHGIDELGVIESAVDHMSISTVIAELNCSRARPFLHVEAGRPNLRALTNWRVLQSNRYTLILELQDSRVVPKDMFSSAPAEVRALIYDYLFPCWHETFHGTYNFEISTIRYPYIMLQNLSFECKRKEGRKYLTGAAALLGVSRLMNQEAAAIMYSQYTFSTTPPFGPSRACCCGQMDHADSFHADIGLLVHFLSHVGPTNRKRLRHLYMGLHSFIPFPKSSKQPQPRHLSKEQLVGRDVPSCLPLCTTNVRSKLLWLHMLIQEIPALDSLTLRFSDNTGIEGTYLGNEEVDDHDPEGPTGRHMLDANYYLNLLSDLRNVKHVEIAGCLGMTDAELFARLVGAETIAVRRNEEKSRMIHERQALDNRPKEEAVVEAQAKAWGWMEDDNGRNGCFVKKLTPGNMTPAVARRLWAVRGMEEDVALMTDHSDELDLRCQ